MSDSILVHCNGCNQDKPEPAFYRFKTGKLKLSCKECAATTRRKPSPYEPAPLGYKRCRQCLEAKLATPEFFRSDKQAKDGLRNQCRECRKAYRRKPLPHTPRKRKPAPVGDKQCIGCKYFFSRTLEHFYSSQTAQDGLQSRCKKCFQKYHMQREKDYPDEARSRRRRYYNAHKAEFAKRQQRYYHSERGRARMRTATLNRIARKKSVQGSYTSAQITEQLKRQKYCCYYAACGFSKFPRIKENGKWRYSYHIEHTFPLSRVAGTDIPANDMGYIVLACVHCNGSKGSKYPWEWPEGGRLL